MVSNTLKGYDAVYFLGIGGIGMSALARYFLINGYKVGGYDRTKTNLTQQLEEEGAWIHYEDNFKEIPKIFKVKTLVIYTPAIPVSHKEKREFQALGFSCIKRAEALGEITRKSKSLCVAGTHGKTTTSTMLAHILNEIEVPCNAFLGGISTNLKSNLLVHPEARYTVVEADEFDRSFLKLSPHSSIITSCDPDHLDIYGSNESFKEGFQQYSMKSSPEGFSIQKEGLNLQSISKVFTYAMNSNTADYSAYNLRYIQGVMLVDVRLQNRTWGGVKIGLPGVHNAENALACIALLDKLQIKENLIRKGLETFLGVSRRFEYRINTAELVFIDDYAHHPSELEKLIDSLKVLFPGKKITMIFQPHLFSRTRDFSNAFAEQLSRVDELILMPIYPAREEPMHGITSDWLLQKIKCTDKSVKSSSEVVAHFKKIKKGVVVTAGAGDIDKLVQPLAEVLHLNID